MKQNSCIVVTGANGLAGSAVVEHFHKRDFTNIVELTRQECNLMSPDETRRFFTDAKPEFVFHAAALVYGLQGNMDNQAKSIYENTLINTNVVHASAMVGVKKIIAMGSNCVYPTPPVLPYREEAIFDGRPDPGEAAYGHAKRHMLAMLEAYHDSHGTDYAYLVSGNLYGPRDTFDPVNGHVMPSLIHKFYEAAQTGGEVSIWGDGATKRDFLYSGDLADVVSFMMGNLFTGAINIGSGETTSIKRLAGMLGDLSGVPPERVRFDPSKPKGRPTCYADLSKLDGLGWTAPTPLYRGLEQTYDWYCADREPVWPKERHAKAHPVR